MTYRDRREARADRLEGWADKRAAKATAAFETADSMASVIPFGQPIMVGHYTEGRDRRYRARIGSNMDKGIAHSRKAEEMSSKAANIRAAAEHAIYSDDEDAIERLKERIDDLEAERDRIKRYNATCRKGQRDASILTPEQVNSLVSMLRHAPYQSKNGEFPSYALTNLSSNINRQKKRLAELQA
jgi:hypothetical protein